MADYDWSTPCSECKTPNFMSNNHKRDCSKHPDYRQNKLADELGGFEWIRDIYSYFCLRGCGCVVHDPTVHAKNVCTIWSGNL